MRPAIQIIAMRSWGELGNLLAARTLAAALRGNVAGEVAVLEAESFVPRFAEIGERIESLIARAERPSDVRRDYLALMDSLEREFPTGFEADGDLGLGEFFDSAVTEFMRHFQETRPTVVCGTKGVISRLCMAALRRADHPASVINFVTNEGLLSFPIHRSTDFECTLVQLERTRRCAIELWGYPEERVHTVGRLIATDLTHPARTVAPARGTRVLVFSNRGGAAYHRLLEHLAVYHSEVSVMVIALRQPLLVETARRLANERRLRHWHEKTTLDQHEYLGVLQWLASSEYSLLVAKSGPNTTLEAARFGIPVALLDSGLPMESWVADLVAHEAFGVVCDDAESWLNSVDGALSNPSRLMAWRSQAQRFAQEAMNEVTARERIAERFCGALARARIGT